MCVGDPAGSVALWDLGVELHGDPAMAEQVDAAPVVERDPIRLPPAKPLAKPVGAATVPTSAAADGGVPNGNGAGSGAVHSGGGSGTTDAGGSGSGSGSGSGVAAPANGTTAIVAQPTGTQAGTAGVRQRGPQVVVLPGAGCVATSAPTSDATPAPSLSLAAVFRTKRTPVFSVAFSTRNLLLVAGPYVCVAQ